MHVHAPLVCVFMQVRVLRGARERERECQIYAKWCGLDTKLTPPTIYTSATEKANNGDLGCASTIPTGIVAEDQYFR
jgi:hypothetical protein